jgi:hypothetical protein
MKEVYNIRESEEQDELGFTDKLREAYKGEDYKSAFRNVPLGEEQLKSQVSAEIEFGQRLEGLARNEAPQVTVSGGISGTGILPIQIQVPTGGQVYRFAKTIIKTEDPLAMSFTYGTNWLMSAIKWAILALVLCLLYLNRRTLSRASGRGKRWLDRLLQFYRRHDKTANTVARSIMTPVVLLGLLLPSWFISRPLTVLVLFLLWVSVVYQITLRWRSRAVDRSVTQGQSNEDKTQDLT